jgi:hypothetical protein
VPARTSLILEGQLDDWPRDIDPLDMEPFDMEPFDMEPLAMLWVDDILS